MSKSQGKSENAAQCEPLHVKLSEPCTNPREQSALAGRSVRLNGKLHDFAPLVEFYGSSFVASLLDAFTAAYVHAAASTTERRGGTLRRFLMWLASEATVSNHEAPPIRRVFEAFCGDRPSSISENEMRDAVEAFVSPIRDLTDTSIISTSNELTRQNVIQTLSPALQDLAAQGLWPNIGPIAGIKKGASTRGTNIPSLGELARPSERTSKHSMIYTYAQMMERNKERLARLRLRMEDILLEEEAAFDYGQNLLHTNSDISLDQIREAVLLLPANYGKTGKISAQLTIQKAFPLDNDELRLSSLLRYIRADLDSCCRLQELPTGLQSIVATCGGIRRVMSYFEGGPFALMAAYTIILIDTGINIQPCDDLAADPFTGRVKYGKIQIRRISSVKKRAGHKPIDAHLIEEALHNENNEEHEEIPINIANVKISSSRTIAIWQKLSAAVRQRAKDTGNPEADYLWIIRNGNSPRDARRYQHHSWKHWWSEFLETIVEDPVLGSLPIQRRMIRTTVLQLRHQQNDADSKIISLLSGHSNHRTGQRHYFNRAYIRRALDEKIREFQKLFEAGLVGDGSNRAIQLDMTPEELSRRHKKAIETGLGFTCLDPTAGIQPGAEEKTCDHLHACSSCSLLRFVPSVESIRALLLFQRSLEASQESFCVRNPHRWVRVWLPALALCKAITIRLATSSKRKLLDQAIAALDASLARNELMLFQPW